MSVKICVETVPGMGLGNRMKCLLSAMRFCQLTGHSFGLLWSKDAGVPCDFEDLFEMAVGKLESPNGCEPFRSWRLWVTTQEIPKGWARAYPSEDVEGCAIDLEYERIPQTLREAYLEQFARLLPHADILRRARQIAVGEFVAVHVRDGHDWDAWGRGVELEQFFGVMDSYPAQTRFFVSSHTQGTTQRMCDRYPGRVMHQAGKDYSGQTVRRMQDSVVDLLCLARGTELIGTFGSTFSEMAWWIGGCQQAVTIVRGDQKDYRWI